MDETVVMLDSTTVKVYQYGGGDKKSYDQETGCSRRGLTTKVHVIDGWSLATFCVFCSLAEIVAISADTDRLTWVFASGTKF